MTLVLDAATPLGFAIWLVQVVLVWLASLWANPRQIVAIWAMCSLSIVLGFWFSGKSGLILWVEISNIILGLAATAAITHTCLRQRAAEAARRQAQEAALRIEAGLRYQELKRLLLETVAHKVQTPLTSIRAGISAILADNSNPDQREWLSIMDGESARLSAAVADTIHLGRIEAGCAALDKRQHLVDDLLSPLLQTDQASAQFQFEFPHDLPAVDADARLVQMAIRLIMENSLKYAPSAMPIRVCARAEQDEITISIIDRGPGMSREEQARIEEHVGQYGAGAGLFVEGGLAIARQAIEAQGGRLSVRSGAGAGTTVSFTLPVSRRPHTSSLFAAKPVSVRLS